MPSSRFNLLGVDTGGTFTDFILLSEGQLRTHKVLSTPAAPEEAILQGITELGLREEDAPLMVIHGSTVATNAVLEGKGVNTVYITNYGLADVLTIGRQTRKELYNLQPGPVTPPVPSGYCLETGGRLSAQGEVLQPLTEEELTTLAHKVNELAPQAVAINLLFSYLDDDAEKRIASAMPQELFVSRSSEVLAEYKEYERGIVTWLNSYVGPLVKGYIHRLQQGLFRINPGTSLSVMQSSGGTISAEHAGQQAVHMLLSGPAGGLAAARFMGDETGKKSLLTFDMGGTSTDVSMIEGDLQLTSEGEIAGYPVSVPMVDMHTIGAGGGSIASIDQGGLLQVGPESAGANPGPACYGKGDASLATVTDANLVLGRLLPGAFLGGGMQLDITAAKKAIMPIASQLELSVEEAAQGIIKIANEHMSHALRVMSVQRGIDPVDLTLVSFGGAGGLHVCALADALLIKSAMVPRYAGVLSAMGMLVAPRARQLSQTFNVRLGPSVQDEIELRYQALLQQGVEALEQEGVKPGEIDVEYSIDCRYVGQSYFLNIKWQSLEQLTKAFHQLHAKRYGHSLKLDIEIVNLRIGLKAGQETLQLPALEYAIENIAEVSAKVSLYGIEEAVPVYQRDNLKAGQSLKGPALITETVSTTFIEAGWNCDVDRSGCLLLQKV